MLILDTNHLDALIMGHVNRDLLVARLEAATEHVIVTTIISVQEKMEGWLSAINGRNMTAERQIPYYAEIGKLLRFFASWEVLPFDACAAQQFDRLKALRVANVGPLDLKIAAIALCNDAILLTRDGDFSRLRHPDLRIEDWLIDEPEV